MTCKASFRCSSVLGVPATPTQFPEISAGMAAVLVLFFLLGYVLYLYMPYRQGTIIAAATVLVCLAAGYAEEDDSAMLRYFSQATRR